MPSARLQACYSSQLLDQKEGDNVALDYLQQTRGLAVPTLRKYGVGRAAYKFRNDDGEWQSADCVTFAWILTAKDIAYQESIRGAKFVYQNSNDDGSEDTMSQHFRDAAGLPSAEKKKTAKKKGQKKEQRKATSQASEEDDALPGKDDFLTRRIKVRAIENKAWQRLDPPGGGWGLFGFHTVPSDAKEIVLTEGEYDAMAVWQATGRPAVSLPNGCRSLPLDVLPLLEDFDTIFLWCDSDAAGQEGAEDFAKKLGLKRCRFVRPTSHNCPGAEKLPKDANEALLQGLDLERIIADAKLKPHEQILTFADLRDEVLHEIRNPDKYVGVPMPSLPGFTGIIKGFRKRRDDGHYRANRIRQVRKIFLLACLFSCILMIILLPRFLVSLLLAPGKTTFLGQLSIDLAEQEVNTLWGSFEIKNARLVQKLMRQHAREQLPTDHCDDGKLDAIADQVSESALALFAFPWWLGY